MKKTIFHVTLIALTFPYLFSGCATIVSKTIYPVTIHSRPSGANFTITDKKGNEVFKGQTPSTVKLRSGGGYFARADYKVRISSPGFEEQIVPISYKINGWYFGNILIGGVFGMLIVDPLTGAMWKIENQFLDFNLHESVNTSNAPELQILNIADVPQNMKMHLVSIK